MVDKMELDLALIAMPTNTPEGLYVNTLFEDPLHLVHHKDRKNKKFKDKELLLLAEGNCLRDHVLLGHDLSKEKISDIKCTSLSTLVAMINMQVGVSFLPEMSIKQSVSSQYPDLVVEAQCKRVSRGISVACRNAHPNKKEIIQISNLLKNN